MSDGEGDDDDKRASKKRKATRACDRCNSQHQPCDNSLPKCSVCERAGVECTYDRPIRKRGPRVGYTSQNGERLWSVVLKARPEIEDLVLQLLRDGTYGDSGVPNAQFIKNNDNQTELVNHFNDSRIGRFLQHGDSEALRIPPPEQKYAIVPAERLQGLGNGHVSRGIGGLLNDTSPSSGPHGAPQNPGDIYLQSDDIGRRKVQVQYRPAESPSINSYSPDVTSQSAAHSETSNKYTSSAGDSWKECNPFSYLDPPKSKRPATESAPEPAAPTRSESRAPSSGFTPATFDIGSMEISHWFDPIPTETLLNLGFDGGESMAQDWFELCENPDPVVDKQAVSPAVTTTSLGEDEEEVWRRLVMRGRFM